MRPYIICHMMASLDGRTYAVGVDTSGTLLWGDNTTDQFGKPLLMILSEWASQDYLDYLKMKTISYITVGREGRLEEDPNLPGAMVGKGPEIDLEAAMEILHDEFGIKRLDGDSAGGLPAVFPDDGKGRPGGGKRTAWKGKNAGRGERTPAAISTVGITARR